MEKILWSYNNTWHKLLILFLFLCPANQYASARQAYSIKYNHQKLSGVLDALQKEHFPVKQVKKKFLKLLRHSEIKNEQAAECRKKEYYDAFVKEWARFTQHELDSKDKDRFLRFADEHGLNDENVFGL